MITYWLVALKLLTGSTLQGLLKYHQYPGHTFDQSNRNHWERSYKLVALQRTHTALECRHVKVLQSCLTPWNSMDCSSSVHEISQTRILEWVAISFSRRSSWPRIEPASSAQQMDSLPLSHQGSPLNIHYYNFKFCWFSLVIEDCKT